MTSNISKIDAQLAYAGLANTRHAFQNTEFTDIEYYDWPRCETFMMTKSGVETQPCKICCTQRRVMRDQKIANRYVYANHIADAEAQQLLNDFVGSINSDLTFLREHVLRYGDMLTTRWKNKGKSRSKREELLSGVMPDLQGSKHPIPRFFYEINNWYDCPADRKAWLLPWLSIEALLDDPQNILHLLHNRTAYNVDEWVMFDNKHLDPGWHSGGLRIQYNENSVVMQGSDYGKLAKFNYAYCHRWYHIAYPRARLILEAQVTLYGFLRKFVETLLDGAHLIESSENWKQTFNAANPTSQRTHAERYATDMFATPPTLAPRSMFEVVDARRKEAEDELWLLQTDPAYVQHLIRQELSSKAVKMYEEDRRWGDIACNIFVSAIDRVDHFQCLAGMCSSVADMYKQHEQRLGPGKEIPLEYERALVALEYMASTFAARQVDALDELVSKSKAYQDNFIRKKRSDGRIDITPKPDRISGVIGGKGSIDYYKDDPVFWAIYYLPECFCIPREIDVFDATMLLDFLDNKLAASAELKRRKIDQPIYLMLSDLAVLNQILTALRTHRPRIWMDAIPIAEREAMCATLQPYRTIANKTCGGEGKVSALSPKLEKFHNATWPIGAKDKAWLEQANHARALFASFWTDLSAVRGCAMVERGIARAEIEEALAMFHVSESPEHHADLEAERAMIEKRSEARSRNHESVAVITATLYEHSITPKVKLDAVAKKNKVKSRPQTAHGTPNNVQSTTALCQDPEKPQLAQIHVKANNLSMFKKMYTPPDEPLAKSGVGWQHFLATMAEAGFAISQSRGSAVMFSRAEGAIVIHRPHPDPTLTSLMLLVIGKRLRRWFGWSGEVFAERR